MECVNLKKQYGRKYRVGIDPSYRAETGSSTNSCADSWYYRLRGSRGYIYSHGGDLLGVCIDGHRVLCHRLSKEPWVIDARHGDDGIDAVFHVNDFAKARAYAKLYRKKKLSPEHLEALRERAKKNLHGRKPRAT